MGCPPCASRGRIPRALTASLTLALTLHLPFQQVHIECRSSERPLLAGAKLHVQTGLSSFLNEKDMAAWMMSLMLLVRRECLSYDCIELLKLHATAVVDATEVVDMLSVGAYVDKELALVKNLLVTRKKQMKLETGARRSTGYSAQGGPEQRRQRLVEF